MYSVTRFSPLELRLRKATIGGGEGGLSERGGGVGVCSVTTGWVVVLVIISGVGGGRIGTCGMGLVRGYDG